MDRVREAIVTKEHDLPVFVVADISRLIYLYIGRERESDWVKWDRQRAIGDWGSRSCNVKLPPSQASGGKTPVARRWENMERNDPESFGNPEKKSLLIVHDEGSWEARGLEGDGSQQMSPGGKGAFFSIICWYPTLAPQGITKATCWWEETESILPAAGRLLLQQSLRNVQESLTKARYFLGFWSLV